MLKINILLILFLKADGIFFGGGGGGGCNCGQSCTPCQSSCSNPCSPGVGGSYYPPSYKTGPVVGGGAYAVSGGGAYAVSGPAAVVGSVPQPVGTTYSTNSDTYPGGRLDGFISSSSKKSVKPPSDSFNGW